MTLTPRSLSNFTLRSPCQQPRAASQHRVPPPRTAPSSPSASLRAHRPPHQPPQRPLLLARLLVAVHVPAHEALRVDEAGAFRGTDCSSAASPASASRRSQSGKGSAVAPRARCAALREQRPLQPRRRRPRRCRASASPPSSPSQTRRAIRRPAAHSSSRAAEQRPTAKSRFVPPPSVTCSPASDVVVSSGGRSGVVGAGGAGSVIVFSWSTERSAVRSARRFVSPPCARARAASGVSAGNSWEARARRRSSSTAHSFCRDQPGSDALRKRSLRSESTRGARPSREDARTRSPSSGGARSPTRPRRVISSTSLARRGVHDWD